jgi:hypothetical protein
MAREVYADPFGSYIQGYDTGVQRQMQQEQNVRAARDVDWNFYNMKPIELETAQRNNAFQAYADPYQRRMLPIGVDRARTELFTNQFNAAMPLSYLGLTGPAASAIGNYTGMGFVNSQDGTQFYNPNGGGAVGPTITPEGFNSVYPVMREEQNRLSQEDWLRRYQIESQRQEAISKDAYARSVAAQEADVARRTQGGATGYTMGSPMFSFLWGAPPQSSGQTVQGGNPYPGQYPTPAPVAAPNYLAPYLPQAR